MVGFNVVRDIGDMPSRKLPVSSLTAAVGDLLELTAGSTTWAKVTSSSSFFTRKAIVMEPATSASNILCMELSGNELVRAAAANASDVANNGDRMAFTDENAVNNSDTDVTGQAIGFVQTGVVGASADNQIVGYVLVGNGVDPDAS